MQRSIIKDRPILLKIAAATFWLVVWQISSILIGQDLILVSPAEVLRTLCVLIVRLDFWQSLGFTFLRITLGFLLSMTAGIVLGILSAKFSVVEILIRPLVSVIKSTPIVSFIILALMLISSKNLAVLISFLMSVPVIYTNVLEGIRNVDQKLLEMARVFHIRPLQRLIYIYLPSLMPYYLSACTVALGLCWKSGISAEVIGLPTGSIGERLYQAKIFFSTADLLAWTVVIIIVSVLFDRLFSWAVHRIQRRLETM